jgi:hypothetical protein
MLKIIDEGTDSDITYNWDENDNPPSTVFLEDSSGQCIAQILCKNQTEQLKYSKLLAASTDMKTLLIDLINAYNTDKTDITNIGIILNAKVKTILNYINGDSNA